jgi:hypothetical protein
MMPPGGSIELYWEKVIAVVSMDFMISHNCFVLKSSEEVKGGSTQNLLCSYISFSAKFNKSLQLSNSSP